MERIQGADLRGHQPQHTVVHDPPRSYIAPSSKIIHHDSISDRDCKRTEEEAGVRHDDGRFGRASFLESKLLDG